MLTSFLVDDQMSRPAGTTIELETNFRASANVENKRRDNALSKVAE